MSPEKYAYYASERAIAADPSDPRRVLPEFPADARVLDVGCGGGWDGQARGTARFAGIDVDPDAIAFRKELDPADESYVGSGEDLSRFGDGEFDFLMSRVAVPYMDVNRFLAEAARVLRTGGALWISLHDVGLVRSHLAESIRRARLKDILFRSYVLLNGAYFHVTGRLFHFPVLHRMESFQSERSIKRALARAGFADIRIERHRGRHFVVQAQRR
jgi:SAM-dependent methyltransferase